MAAELQHFKINARKRLAFNVWRSTSGVQRLAFNVWRAQRLTAQCLLVQATPESDQRFVGLFAAKRQTPNVER
jgi:hypothetical protein